MLFTQDYTPEAEQKFAQKCDITLKRYLKMVKFDPLNAVRGPRAAPNPKQTLLFHVLLVVASYSR